MQEGTEKSEVKKETESDPERRNSGAVGNLSDGFFLRMIDQSERGFLVVKVELDDVGNPCDWIYAYCNDAAAKLADRSKEHIFGRRFSEVFPDGSPKWLSIYYRAAFHGEKADFEEFSEEAGTYIHFTVASSGQPGYCCCFVEDARKELYRKAVESSRDSDGTIDDEAGKKSLIDALCLDYTVVFLCDLKKDTLEILKCSPFSHTAASEKELPKELRHSYSARMRYIYEHVVVQESAPDYLEKFLPENLMQILFRQDSFELRHRTVRNQARSEYFSIKAVRLYADEESFKAIVGILPISEQVRREQENQRRLEDALISLKDSYDKLSVSSAMYEEQLAIARTFSRNFRNVYLLNLSDATAKVMKFEDEYCDNRIDHVMDQNFPYEGFVNEWIEEAVHPDDREMLKKALSCAQLQEVFSHQEEYSGNYRMLVDGKEIHYQFNISKMDKPGFVIAGFQNIEDIIQKHLEEEKKQRAKEEAYQKELKRQLQVINALGREYSALYLVDGATQRWTVFKEDTSGALDHVHKKVLIYENYEEAIGAYISNFVVESDRENFRKHAKLKNLLVETSYTGIHSLSYDRILNGVREHWQMNAAKFRADDGKEYVVLGFRNVHDIVEKQINQENALRDALMLARHANRAKTTFLNNMSHDIRTPMNAIIGFTALAETRIDHQEQVQDYLRKIHTSGTHLLSLINEILDMSRIESGTVKLEENIVHIPDVLHDLRTIIQGQVAAKQQSLYIDSLDVTHEDVVTDKLRLNQILLNIVGNAIKYTGCGGNIAVRVTEQISSMPGYGTYEFRVKDNGMGMSPEFVEHVFDAFARERTSTVSGIQGTGLGMSITKNIVDMMNGTIEVESTLGKGSEFIVTVDFRLADDIGDSKPIPELLGARALVVDDDVNTCQSVSKMLRGIEMRPDWSTSGKEAVIRAREAVDIKDEYKVYIIDYMMPDMNGIETVRQIRKIIGDEIPIIVLTAYEWVDFEEEAREAGVTDFVSKPIFMSELRAILSRQREDVTEEEITERPKHDYSGKHVLLVEDNELNREIATFLLKDIGIAVDTAEDGIEAVDIMSRAAEDQYDLILMDVQMPKMDGYTATREIRTLKNNRKANIPIVAMTANAFDEDRQKSFEAGMNGHIAKPIDVETIIKTLDGIL